jgi:hypothetical protein
MGDTGQGGIAMASKTRITDNVRARKKAPNKVNLKQEQKRLRKNYEVLAKLESK